MYANLTLRGCARARHNDCARACCNARMVNQLWRTGAYGKLAFCKLAIANWHMAKPFMEKRRIPIIFMMAIIILVVMSKSWD